MNARHVTDQKAAAHSTQEDNMPFLLDNVFRHQLNNPGPPRLLGKSLGEIGHDSGEEQRTYQIARPAK